MRYLLGMHAFRAPIELALETVDLSAAFNGWRPTLIADELRADLDDLQVRVLPLHPPVLSLEISSLFGTLYVLEGASLDARLIQRQTQSLGFIAMLDDAPCIDTALMIDGANPAFDPARHAMQRAPDANA